MHVPRHTAAMRLLNAGADTSTIALWLGHDQERTTHVYLHADLARSSAHAGPDYAKQPPWPLSRLDSIIGFSTPFDVLYARGNKTDSGELRDCLLRVARPSQLLDAVLRAVPIGRARRSAHAG